MVQVLIGNFCFFVLLLTMISYWVQASFVSTSQPHRFSAVGTGLGNVSLLLLMVLRWQQVGQYPLTNLYESLIFLAWSVTLFHLVLEQTSKVVFVGALLSPLALFTLAFATYSVPQELQQPGGLVPALRSNWLIMHVTIMMLSYAALLAGCLFSIAYLILAANADRVGRQDGPTLNEKLALLSRRNPQLASQPSSPTERTIVAPVGRESGQIASLLIPSPSLLSQLTLGLLPTRVDEGNPSTTLPFYWQQLLAILDNLSYRTIGLGFSFLTLGILSGAVWANEAWGSYWSWDPKETWAFVTWLVFAIYLHTRIGRGWQGTKPAAVASCGFLILWICFLGVNLFGKGLHSYGWVSTSS